MIGGITTPTIVCQLRAIADFAVDRSHGPDDVDLLTILEHLDFARARIKDELRWRRVYEEVQ